MKKRVDRRVTKSNFGLHVPRARRVLCVLLKDEAEWIENYFDNDVHDMTREQWKGGAGSSEKAIT